MSKGFSKYDKEYQQNWREKNREHVRELNRASYHRNKEGRLARANAKYVPSDRVKLTKEEVAAHRRAASALHKKKYRAYYTAKQRMRHAAKTNRTPKWANLARIKNVYLLAAWASKFTEEPLHVDHIIPLRGKFISGLHVENNLQILTRSENCKKSNGWSSS